MKNPFLFFLFTFSSLLSACSPTPTPTIPATVAPSATPIRATITPSVTSTPVLTLTATPNPKSQIQNPKSESTQSPTPLVTPAWFRHVVLYEIFPRSFYDSNGDGIGDLKGITAKLDYLHDLGVGALWLTPIFASPSYHGYDTTDYYAVNPDFGTKADLEGLVQEAHKRGLRILLDYVVAHTSNEHPFFKDALGNPASKYADWYRWTNQEHTRYESFAGVKEMPSLNHDNPDVDKYFIEVAKYWMATGIDGYRADYVLNVPHSFWKKLRKELKAISPDFVLLAEAWTNARDIKPYFEDEFDAAFDFPLYGDIEGNQDAVGDSFLLGNRSPHLMDGTFHAEEVLFPPGAERIEFVNNHDTNRVMSEVKGDLRRAKLAATLLLTLPNTPMVYYGEEIGMAGVKASAPDYDKTRREPMDWYAAETGPGMTTWYKPLNRNNKPNDGISVEEESNNTGLLLEYYRTLVSLRNGNPVLQTGTLEEIGVDNDEVFAYLLRDSRDAFLVLLNFSNATVSESVNLIGASLPITPVAVVDELSKARFPFRGSSLQMQLEPATAYVLRLVAP